MIRHNTIAFFILILGGILAITPACNSGGDATTEEGTETQGEESSSTQQVVPEGDHASWTFLTNGYLVNRNTVKIGQDPKENPIKGHWYDLKTDGTFDYGDGSTLLYTGVWSYDHPSTKLELLPNDKNAKKSQWKVMYNEDNIVLIGTEKYSDNNTQMQFVRKMEKPGSEG